MSDDNLGRFQALFDSYARNALSALKIGGNGNTRFFNVSIDGVREIAPEDIYAEPPKATHQS